MLLFLNYFTIQNTHIYRRIDIGKDDNQINLIDLITIKLNYNQPKEIYSLTKSISKRANQNFNFIYKTQNHSYRWNNIEVR
jgi:hypothetical protein